MKSVGWPSHHYWPHRPGPPSPLPQEARTARGGQGTHTKA